MSNLLDKVRAQRAAIEATNKRFGPRLPFFKLVDKKATIRVLPAWTNEGPFAGQFWREAGQHWNVKDGQEGPVLCPKVSEGYPDGAECPICEFAKTLASDKTNIAAQTTFNEIKAKKVYFLAVQDLKNPVYTKQDVAALGEPREDSPKEGDPKVQVYACPKGLFNDILGIIDANNCDITSLTEGRDLVIEKSVPGGKQNFTKYKVLPMMNPTKAQVPADFQTPSLDSVGWKMTAGELLQLLSDGKGGKHVASLGAGKDEPEDDSSYLSGDAPVEGDKDLESMMRAELSE